ncbi:MAG TPA: hypothetical protein VK871_13625, partial [Candidatus Limnocylindrales bacterium]|nr:hypothetical protein [Candidatus Limnocylindrales bacterium]
LEGTLAVSGESPCVELRAVGEPPVGLVWPPGYTARYGPLRIYNEAGVEIASEGAPVTLTGGITYEPNAVCRTSSLFRVAQVFKGAAPDAH